MEWNEGHLLYQFTYFVGPVNYYYLWDDVAHFQPMNTGDSVWGVPFAPHSFTTRTPGGYILALTYGGDLVGDAQRELSVLGPRAAKALATARGSPAHGRPARRSPRPDVAGRAGCAVGAALVGNPQWPFIVDEFFLRLDDPDHDHWSVGGHPGPPPASMYDSAMLRELMLSAPDELPTDVVSYFIDRGALGFVRL